MRSRGIVVFYGLFLVNDAEGTVPAGEAEAVEEAGGGGGGLRGVRQGEEVVVVSALAEGEVDEQRAAYDVLGGDEAPVAGVFTVVAVVAEDEVVVVGDDEFAVVDELAHADPPAGVDLGVSGLE